MRIALAQIDARLGDIEGVCERLESQAAVARDQGADLICIPSPLLTGIVPGALIESANFEHDLVSELSALAGRLAELGIVDGTIASSGTHRELAERIIDRVTHELAELASLKSDALVEARQAKFRAM